jgi:broad specificity phosphatase PhoE
MRIIFVRHGESEHNAGKSKGDDTPLTKKGRMQAELLGRTLKKQKISVIYTSNLLRAKQTGEIISKIIKVPVKASFEELNEYTTNHVKSRLKSLLSLRVRRLRKLISKLAKDRNKNKTILIVAHGITNRIMMGYLLQFPLKKQLLRFKQHNTCINSISWSKEFKNWAIEYLNNTSHLPKRLKEEYLR